MKTLAPKRAESTTGETAALANPSSLENAALPDARPDRRPAFSPAPGDNTVITIVNNAARRYATGTLGCNARRSLRCNARRSLRCNARRGSRSAGAEQAGNFLKSFHFIFGNVYL